MVEGKDVQKEPYQCAICIKAREDQDNNTLKDDDESETEEPTQSVAKMMAIFL